jgi:DNA-binding beta-propeller fold protein YncE
MPTNMIRRTTTARDASWLCARLLCFIALLVVLGSCSGNSNAGGSNDAGGGGAATGSIYVTVVDSSNVAVSDATVTTMPDTQSLVTDALGSVLFSGIAAGAYAVTAAHPVLGASRVPVSVFASQIAQVTITLKKRLDIVDGGAPGADSGPTRITLNAPSKDATGVALTWTTMDSFSSFRVQRSIGSAGMLEAIQTLLDPGARQYHDNGAILGSYTYRIAGVLPTGIEVLSNAQTIKVGDGIAIGSQVEQMVIDRTRPYLYALDKVNNSLHFVNLGTKLVEGAIFVGSSPVDMDISQAGNKLFIANFGSTEIAVVDLDTRKKSGSLFVNTKGSVWDGNPYRLVSTIDDTVVFTSEDQWNDLKLVNALTGAAIQNIGTIYEPDLATSPDGATVYVGESGSSGSTLKRFDIVSGKLMQVDESVEVGGYGDRLVVTSRDGTYLFYAGKKFLAKNLKSVLGTFSEPILVSNATGSVVVGAKNIHDGTTFSIKKPLPLSASVMALSPDDATLYLYETLSSTIYAYPMNAP